MGTGTRILFAVWQWLALEAQVNHGASLCDQVIIYGAGHVKLLYLGSKSAKLLLGDLRKHTENWWWW